MKDERSISDVDVTVLDFETTGSVRGFPSEPWQIGAVALSGGRLDPSTVSESLIRVDANRPFNPNAPGRHAVLRDEISRAPAPDQVWGTYLPRLSGCPLCAHNVSTEKKVLRSMAPMHRFGPWIDTLRIARKAWPGLNSYALEDLIVTLDLHPRIEELCPGREAHDALYDAVAAGAVLEKLISRPEWGRLTVSEWASV